MLKTLSGNTIADLTTSKVPATNLEMFREIEKALVPHYRVKLDSRRFHEIGIDGPDRTHTQHGRQSRFAIRIIQGSATFWVNSFNPYELRVQLRTGNWLYVPECSGYNLTSGSSSSDYPCRFVVASMPTQ